jgi:carboxymethylenebutenolidase
VVGYCWGGGHSFNYAVAQPNLSAAVVYYGSTPSDMSVLATIKAPVLGLYGGNDARITANVEPTAAKMKELGKSYTYSVYAGAATAFCGSRPATMVRTSKPRSRRGRRRWPSSGSI